MLTVAQGLVRRPRLLMLDEPSAGLSPVLVDRVLSVIAQLRKQGTAVLLVEQLLEKALAAADRVYALVQGNIVLEAPTSESNLPQRLEHAYFGHEKSCGGDRLMRLPFFYGWMIVAVTFVTMAIGVNARTAFSLFFPPIVSEFGWERGVTAGAFSFGFVVSAAVSPLIGRMMDRFGPRGVMELGVALMGSGLLLAPLTSQPWHLYLTIGVLVGAGSVCLGYSGQSLFLPNWFIRRRGLAMGLAFAGVGIGSVTLLPWVQHLIEQTGWRTACTAMGILVLAVLAPINLLLRERPENIGLLPDGDAAPTATSAKPVSNIVDPVLGRLAEVAVGAASPSGSNPISSGRFRSNRLIGASTATPDAHRCSGGVPAGLLNQMLHPREKRNRPMPTPANASPIASPRRRITSSAETAIGRNSRGRRCRHRPARRW